jgi:hypothetical protein
MPTNICQRTAMAAAIAACFPAIALGAGAARVDFAVGNVTATSPDGRSRALNRGAEINEGDTVNTQQGRAQLRFADGAYMSLQPQTEFKIEEFKYAGKEDGSENIVMNLLKGGMRTITGLIGRSNRNNYKLKTEVATIGIRGTEYSVQYTNSIDVFCAGGSINLENQGGSLTISGGQGASVQNQNTAPQQNNQPPVLSPATTTQQKQQEEEQKANNDPVNEQRESQQKCDPSKESCSTADALGVQGTTLATGPTLLTGTVSVHGAFSHQSLLEDQISPTSTAVLDTAGGLVSFTNADIVEGPSAGATTLGGATVVSQGNDGIVAWGRWVNGTTGGDGMYSNQDLIGEGPLHYVVGLPATNMPTSGIGTYTMIGSTTPSVSGGFFTGASVASSSITVDFATTSAMFSAQWNVTTISTSGTASVTDMPILRNGAGLAGSTSSVSTTGSLSSLCTPHDLSVKGFLAGDGATRAGMAYHLGFTNSTHNVHGAIAYKKSN